jgi:hypothetical protein
MILPRKRFLTAPGVSRCAETWFALPLLLVVPDSHTPLDQNESYD